MKLRQIQKSLSIGVNLLIIAGYIKDFFTGKENDKPLHPERNGDMPGNDMGSYRCNTGSGDTCAGAVESRLQEAYHGYVGIQDDSTQH